jgi:hypothetical protein
VKIGARWCRLPGGLNWRLVYGPDPNDDTGAAGRVRAGNVRQRVVVASWCGSRISKASSADVSWDFR